MRVRLLCLSVRFIFLRSKVLGNRNSETVEGTDQHSWLAVQFDRARRTVLEAATLPLDTSTDSAKRNAFYSILEHWQRPKRRMLLRQKTGAVAPIHQVRHKGKETVAR